MHLSPIVCHSMTPMIGARVRCVRGRHMLAGASERARSVREHDKARMSLHLRGRSRRELLSAPPCASHVHDFSPAFSMTFPIPQVISREFGREHRHMMHESCFTHREQHHGVLSSDLPNSREITLTRQKLFPHPDKIAGFRRMVHKNKHS